jgi:hypothetical protein
VTAYHDDDPTFPHHSTADQLYTDQKFEAYRALGWCAGNHAAEMMDEPEATVEEAVTATVVTTNGNRELVVSVPSDVSRVNVRRAGTPD